MEAVSAAAVRPVLGGTQEPSYGQAVEAPSRVRGARGGWKSGSGAMERPHAPRRAETGGSEGMAGILPDHAGIGLFRPKVSRALRESSVAGPRRSVDEFPR